MKQNIVVSGMTCNGCVNSVKSLLLRVNGVNNVSVELANGETILEVDHEIPITDLRQALKVLPQYQIED